MFQKLKKIIDKKDKLNLIFLFFILIVSTFLEMIGIGVIPIFTMIFIEPSSIIEKLPGIFDYNFIYDLDKKVLAMYMLITLVMVFIIKNSFLVFVNYFSGMILKRIRENLTNKMFRDYINSKYEFHIQRNSADLIRNVNSEVSKAVYYIIGHVSLIKEILILFMIFLILTVTSTKASLLIFVFLGIFSIIFFLFTRKSSQVRGKLIQEYWGKQTRTLKHGMGSIKEIKMLKKEKFIFKIFQFNTNMIESYNFMQSFIVTLPRLFLEVITILGISAILISFTFSNQSIESFIPLIVLISVSAVRLIPSFSVISQSIATIKYQSASFELIIKEINDMQKLTRFRNDQGIPEVIEKINFDNKIEIKNLTYNYPLTEKKIIENISFEIKPGERVGIAGKSGAGKSTLLDLLCGLLQPSEGKIIVDGIDINKKENNWKEQIGYVPQETYLLDDTIKSNIAFGLEEKDFDDKRFKKALKMSQLDGFIETLPEKELTNVGDQGIRLSGGQKQRIGIARALYFMPKILILDEPTSALDGENESLILNDMYNLNSKITLIIISHRMNVFENCQKIYTLKMGKLVKIK
tara:strand:- start:3111 stop:4844 length:1734 start_codon:yes stop_codon:yes gene_type:complete